MANRRITTEAMGPGRTVRASISFPEDHYKELERIAVQHKVSLAWVVRDAIEGYLKVKWPLLEEAQVAENIPNK